jgi:cytochrome d ubiquinol oxidase subunit II
LTPFCFAAALGGIASGRIAVGGPAVPIWQACLNPTSIMFGLIALAVTTFSGASFLLGDARRYGAEDLVAYFRRRAIVAALATLVLGAIALAVIRVDTPIVFRGMAAGRGLPFAVLAVVATLAVALMLWRGIYRWYRVLTVIAAGSFVIAWGLGQSPYLLPGRLRIHQAVGAPSVELFLVVASVVALVIVIPSLALLYMLDQRNDLVPTEEADD